MTPVNLEASSARYIVAQLEPNVIEVGRSNRDRYTIMFPMHYVSPAVGALPRGRVGRE